MQQSLHDKLKRAEERHEELRQLLAEPDVLARPDRYRELSREFARLEPVTRTLEEYRRALAELENNEAMAADSDPEIRTLAETELARTRDRVEGLEDELQRLMLPSDPYDDSSVYLEIRAGTGGDEAALFAGDLLRMYTRYAEREGWTVDIVSASEGEQGGYREVVLHVSGTGVYGRLKFESGAHRVQRVPKTESQGRIHTSACTVAVLPETESVEDVAIHDQDLRIDTFRASGAGGQHVNTTDSAVRITHLPSGVVVESQQERSQHKNRARALSVLKAKLVAMEQARQARELEDTRRSLIGSGDRSERIRTYNFPQSRVTDHRIDLTLYKLDDILDGALEPVIDPLLREHQLAQLGEVAS